MLTPSGSWVTLAAKLFGTCPFGKPAKAGPAQDFFLPAPAGPMSDRWRAGAQSPIYRRDPELVRFLIRHGASWQERHGYNDNCVGTLSFASMESPAANGDCLACAKALIEAGSMPPPSLEQYKSSPEIEHYSALLEFLHYFTLIDAAFDGTPPIVKITG